MKAGWRRVPLGEVCELSGGGTPSKNNPAFYGGSIPWATVRDLNVEMLTQTEHTITEAGLKASSSRIIPAGEIVIASRVGLGKAVILGQDTAINQDLRAVIPRNPDQLDRKFLFLWFKSVADRIIEAGTGATVQGVKLPFLNGLPISLPPLDEQKRIVAVLDEAFEGLTRARANAEANLADARELFGTLADGILQGDLAEQPKQMRLGSIVDRLTNGFVGPTREIYREQGVPYLLARHVRNNTLVFDGRTYVDDAFNEKNRKSKLKGGDVLLVQSGHIGHSAVVPAEHEGHNCHAMIVISAKPDTLTGEYLSAVFNTAGFQAKFQEIRTGSTVPHLTCGMVKELMIPVPSLGRQSEVCAILASAKMEIDDLADAYSKRVHELDTLRQSLLQKAFSGELTR